MCTLEMLFSAIFHFSPKQSLSSCVCPEQLVSWSNKGSIWEQRLRKSPKWFPRTQGGCRRGSSQPSHAHRDTPGCLPSSPYWLSQILLTVTITAGSLFSSWWSHLAIFNLSLPPSQLSFTSSQNSSNIQRSKHCYLPLCCSSLMLQLLCPNLGTVLCYLSKPSPTSRVRTALHKRGCVVRTVEIQGEAGVFNILSDMGNMKSQLSSRENCGVLLVCLQYRWPK